tara:strand:- start:425 stop:952 length:528 start_codon:yes stop_codon:yes gene_type:complete
MSGEWIDERGVESFMSGYVAQRIKENLIIDPSWVLFEVSFKEFFELYCSRFVGNQGIFAESRSRFDLVALDEDEQAFGVVELKRSRWSSAWDRDVQRVKAFSRRSAGQADVNFGAFAAFVSESEGERNILEAFDSIRNCFAESDTDVEIIFERSKFRDHAGKLRRFGIVGAVVVN